MANGQGSTSCSPRYADPQAGGVGFRRGLTRPERRSIRTATAALFIALALLDCGCVRRRLTIRSNPPGAVAYVDDQRIGVTPVSTEFTYYGTRRIRLVKDGYETLDTLQPVAAPWYQYPPIDFVAENVVAEEIRDERILQFELVPQRLVPTQELLGRASNLRTSANQNVLAPLPPGVTPGVMGPRGN